MLPDLRYRASDINTILHIGLLLGCFKLAVGGVRELRCKSCSGHLEDGLVKALNMKVLKLKIIGARVEISRVIY